MRQSLPKPVLKKYLIWIIMSVTIAITSFALNFAVISPVSAAETPGAQTCVKAGGSTFLQLGTKSYDITICGGDNPNTMVIAKKPNGSPESVMLTNTKAQRGNFFEATTADKVYVLSKTPKGNVFTITKVTSTELLREPVTGWP